MLSAQETQLQRFDETGHARHRSRSPRRNGVNGYTLLSHSQAEALVRSVSNRIHECPGLAECAVFGPPPFLLVPLPARNQEVNVDVVVEDDAEEEDVTDDDAHEPEPIR